MLKSWSLHNFKPIRDLDELQLAPVTVLAGRNSSGKSSLIQSILMIAQTLSSRVLDRPLLPHGSFVHLGTFEDILNKYSTIQSLTVGFQLEWEKEDLPVINSVKVTSQFLGAVANGSASSAIEASKVSIEKVLLEVSYSSFDSRPIEFSIDIKKLTDGKLADFLSDVADEYFGLVPYSIKESNYLGEFKTEDQRITDSIPDLSLVEFSHFLPKTTHLIVKFEPEERRRERLTRAVNLIFRFPNDDLELDGDIIDPHAPMPASLNQNVLELCTRENISEAFRGRSLRSLARWYKALKSVRGTEKHIFQSKIKDIVIKSLMEQDEKKTSNALEVMPNNAYVENLELAVEQITRFFTSKIRYLGPLRADPEIIQGFSPSSKLDDVGSKDQYAATVYDTNQNAPIRWYNPSSQEVEEGTLKTALNAWARIISIIRGKIF